MRRPCAVLLFCLLTGIPAFSQNGGIIQCEASSMTSVPAWIAPGKPYVVDQLPCGQAVQVLGRGSFPGTPGYSSRPHEYAKIQVDTKIAYVDAKYVVLTEAVPRPAAKKSAEAVPEIRRAREEEDQKKWSSIEKGQVKLRDETLLKPVYINGPRTFTATLSNESGFSVSGLLLLVRLYDCTGKPRSDYSNCEIIGEAKPVIAASVPPGQTRRIMGSPLFEATPRARGTFAWGYQVLGVRTE